MVEAHILIVEDDRITLDFFRDILDTEGYTITSVENANHALDLVKDQTFDAIILDVLLPGNISGLEICAEIKKMPMRTHIPIILVTSHGTIEMAVKAMELGAFYFLTKPVRAGDLILLIKQAIENNQLHKQIAALKSKLGEDSRNELIGKSSPMRKVLQMIAHVAPRDATVLIQGNSGTGKELVARAIHRNSNRCNHSFVAVDCGAISENLLESELFGHVKGAFTGAHNVRKGIFVRANKGTLFLDEIGNLSLSLQAKLLRAIQEREISPVGSDKTVKVDVRIVAATNVDLTNMVESGEFRKDLFFRLNVITLRLPELIERIEDIPLLAQYFLEKYKKPGNTIEKFSKSSLKILMDYNWPGNIRELENVVEHGMIVAKGTEIQPGDLPAHLGQKQETSLNNLLPVYTLAELEKEYIKQVLKHTQYNQTQTAKILSIDRKSLWRKIKRFGITIIKT